MVTFFCCIIFLIAGYFVYGKFVENKLFKTDPNRPTPCNTLGDSVDYKEMKTWKVFVIQFLNIAGLGPIFGAILGAAYGPMAYLWICLGCVFFGATHDYFSGMMSIRANGRSMPVIMGAYLGGWVRKFMNVFLVLMLVLVGCSFVSGPADLLNQMAPIGRLIWVVLIFDYYIIATILPIDKIIGRIYPFMGALLLFMAVSIAGIMIFNGLTGQMDLYELSIDSFRNFHSNPDKFVLIPMLFVVLSCGAISGFHSTQSPLMARCINNEKNGRKVFYGSMIAEGIVAMIWATVAMNYFGGPEGLNEAAAAGKTPAIIVNAICNEWLGKLGAILAIIGVVCCPITTGDTCFRSTRLLLGDALNINQKPIKNRILLATPVFALAVFVSTVNFTTLWNYVGIANQVIAMFMLWTGAKYLSKSYKRFYLSVPATFITFICFSFFLLAPHSMGGLELQPMYGYIVGSVVALAAAVSFEAYCIKRKRMTLKAR